MHSRLVSTGSPFSLHWRMCARDLNSSSRYWKRSSSGNASRAEIPYRSGGRGSGSLKILAKVCNFPDPQYQVRHTQTGHGAAEKVVEKYDLQLRGKIENPVVLPELHPGEKDEHEPYFKAVEHVNTEKKLVDHAPENVNSSIKPRTSL
jgi:hypothetical protein